MVTGVPDDSSTLRKRRELRASLLGILAAVAVVAVLTGLLYTRVALSGSPPPRDPMPVATTTYTVQDSYTRKVSYLGLVTAGRKADLGFEVPGTLLSAPLRPGTPVGAGDVIALLDQSGLRARRAATAAELEQAEVELELAQIKAARQRDLADTGAVSREAHDETRLRARALQARVEAVRARLASIDIDVEKSRLLAPYDGVVADRYAHQGAVINPGEPIVRLVETAAQEAHIGVAARRAAQLQPGMHYALRLRDQEVQAQLLSVRPDVNPRTRTATAVFALPAAVHALDGEPVSLELAEHIPQRGGWLPLGALQEGSRGVWTVLRVVDRDGRRLTVREAVEVLEVRADRAFVRGTLPSGAIVVASGTHRVAPGTAVSVTEAS